MATPKVYAQTTNVWTDVIGGASGVAGVIWQNIGPGNLQIAFTTSAPDGSGTAAYHNLAVGEGFDDKTGSTHCWVRSQTGAYISATAY